MMAYCVDFVAGGKPVASNKLEVCEYTPEDLAEELQSFGVTDPELLTDFDRCVFASDSRADSFLDQYRALLEQMRREPFRWCHSRDLPALAYRRHMLVFALMRYKLQTNRTFDKGWQPGQLFNLHDRTHFVTVRLQRIVAEKDGTFTYHFDLP